MAESLEEIIIKMQREAATLKKRVEFLETLENTMPTDEATGALLTITYPHHEIHEGGSFEAFLTNASVGAATKTNLLIVTPDTLKWGHLIYSAWSGGQAQVNLYEGTTTSNDGNAHLVYNRNRNSAIANGILVYNVPVVTLEGTLIDSVILSAGNKLGGNLRSLEEFILKQNTKYLAQILAITNNIPVSHKLAWYEHENA